MKILFPLTKMQETGEQRLVFGRAAVAIPDRSNEIMDWETGKKAFQDWSDETFRASGGLSKGNVRMMHDPKRVVGKLVDIQFDDTNKAVDVVAHVVEDDAWRLCKEGCITGFSMGGGYAKKWPDPENPTLIKYTPRISELSLVDRPCIPDATIVLVKSDGTQEKIVLKSRARTFRDVILDELEKPRTFHAVVADAVLAEEFKPKTFGEIMAKRYGDLCLEDDVEFFPQEWPANYYPAGLARAYPHADMFDDSDIDNVGRDARTIIGLRYSGKDYRSDKPNAPRNKKLVILEIGEGNDEDAKKALRAFWAAVDRSVNDAARQAAEPYLGVNNKLAKMVATDTAERLRPKCSWRRGLSRRKRGE